MMRVAAGIAVWIASIGGAWWWTAQRLAAGGPPGEASAAGVFDSPVTGQLWRYVAAPTRRVELEMIRPLDLAVGDPIFGFDGQGAPRRIGEIVRVADAAGRAAPRRAQAAWGEARFYAHAPALAPGARLEYYGSPASLAWVLETMLPPEKRRQIALEMSDAFQQHQEEILRALRPVVEQGLREAAAVVEQDLPQAIARRRPELERLGRRYQHELVEKKLSPLVREEIWPIVQRRGEPLAEEIGEEVWRRASLWRFGWRLAYDVSPLPDKDLTEKEWRRFLRQEAVPVFKSRTDDFIRLQQQILSDVARNERVQEVLRESLGEIADDPEVRRVVGSILRETLIDNPRLRETLERRWRSPQARQAMTIASERLEPTVRRIGDLLLGTRETGVTPEFARVLRSQILGKDRRWLVLTAPPAGAEQTAAGAPAPRVLRVELGRDPVNPFVAEARR